MISGREFATLALEEPSIKRALGLWAFDLVAKKFCELDHMLRDVQVGGR
jgi:hypothetical protein